MTFRELLEAPSDEKKIYNALKSFNAVDIPAIGRYGKEFLFTVIFETKNLKDAKNFDIKGAVKALKKEFSNVVFDKDNQDDMTPGGKFIQPVDWKKDKANDPHEIYVAFKEVTK